jgi:hypothetical protein
MKSPVLTSVTRIVTALVVGFVINLPLAPQALDFFGVTSDQASAWLGAGTAMVVSALYYGVVRWLEEHKNAAIGWLLLVASKPKYDTTTPRSGV